MKVAIYSGGVHAPTFIRRLMLALADQGFDILVFGPDNGAPPPSHPHIKVVKNRRGFAGNVQFVFRFIAGILFHRDEIRTYYAHVRHEWPWASVPAWKAWRKHWPVIMHKPDIFHIQWAIVTNDWFFLKEHFNVKIVVSLRGAHINYSPLFNPNLADSYRRCFPRVDAFHAVSMAISHEAMNYGAPKHKIQVIYSGLPLADFKFNESTKDAPRKFVKILSVGRTHWKKGYRYAIDAVNALKQKGYRVEYTIIGGLATEHLHHIAQLNLHHNVIIKQRVPFQEVKHAMMNSDILLLPSVEEGIANVVLEAMALGTIVVSSNCGGMEEVIKHQVSGFIFPLRRVNTMVECIEQAIALSPEERQNMLLQARRYIELNHTTEHLIEKMTQLYQSL